MADAMLLDAGQQHRARRKSWIFLKMFKELLPLYYRGIEGENEMARRRESERARGERRKERGVA